jgi:hypothetical protein
MARLAFPQGTLFPAVLLAALLGLAAGLQQVAGAAPEAALQRAVVRFHKALFEGRGDVVREIAGVGSAGGGAEAETPDETAWLRRAWLVGSLEIGEDGTGRVDVVLPDREGAGGVVVTERWRAAADGSWRFLDARAAEASPGRRRR